MDKDAPPGRPPAARRPQAWSRRVGHRLAGAPPAATGAPATAAPERRELTWQAAVGAVLVALGVNLPQF